MSMESFPQPNEQHKEAAGVDFVFQQNPELAAIGTKEQYSQHLVFNKENIHVLGSQSDIEKFKEFVG